MRSILRFLIQEQLPHGLTTLPLLAAVADYLTRKTLTVARIQSIVGVKVAVAAESNAKPLERH
eukprot:775619-Amphidinium_carterae.1